MNFELNEVVMFSGNNISINNGETFVKTHNNCQTDDFPGNKKFRETLSKLSKQELIDIIVVYSANRAEMNTIANLISD